MVDSLYERMCKGLIYSHGKAHRIGRIAAKKLYGIDSTKGPLEMFYLMEERKFKRNRRKKA